MAVRTVDRGLDDWERGIVTAARCSISRMRVRLDSANPDVSVIPYQRRPVLPTVPARRVAFREHLDRIIAESFARAPEPEEPQRDETPHPARLDAACALCQGHCCLPGGLANAFLSVAEIDRYRRRSTNATPEAARYVWLDRLPDETVLLSCVFHGDRGCTLPRALRSSTCNDLICRGQSRLAAGDDDRPCVYVAAPRDRPVAVAGWTPTRGYVEGPDPEP